VYATFLSQNVGLSFDVSLWLVVTCKLFFMLIASFLAATSIWFVGNMVGEKNSQRVLFRRLSIVFTVALTAYTAHHLENAYEWMGTASFFLYFWSALLGYFAIREQFLLTHLETAFVGGFAILLVLSSWHLSNHFFESTAKKTLQEIAYKPTKAPAHKVTPRY